MVITGAKGDCKRKSYPYTYKEDDTDGDVQRRGRQHALR